MSHSNSDNRKPKPVRNPKLPKLQKNKSNYDNEMDLWNLEDDTAAANPTVTPIADVAPKVSANTEKLSAALSIEDDSKPFAEIDDAISPPESEGKKEENVRSISVTSIHANRTNSADTRYAAPSRLTVAPTEAEIWGDFVDDVKADPSTSLDASTTFPAVEEDVPVLNQMDSESSKPEIATIITPERKKPALITSPASSVDGKAEEKTEPATEKTIAIENAPHAPVQEPEVEKIPDLSEPAPFEKGSPSIQITKFSRTEVIASLAFLLILIVGSLVVIRSYRSNLTVEKNLYAKPDYPVKGQNAEVKSVITYWRAPIKDGPNPDPIKLDVKMLPVIEITLGSESTQGALRVMFHNEKGDIVGDTVTQNFSQGKFTLSSSESRAFSSTAGFIDFGEQEAYRTGQGKPWTIKVYEGPSDNASSDQFRLLFTTPIATERR